MDIIGRLRLFVDYTGASSSQFADIIGLPRPSISQILNGRNKKISNELITKIHDAFANLNISWLLFGEGAMLINPDEKPALIMNLDFTNENSKEDSCADSPILLPPSEEKPTMQTSETDADKETENRSTSEMNQNAFVNNVNYDKKKIKNIIILYADNTFEIFDSK